jgi:glycosyltransferase involved in cell wall biosynthesis
MKTDLAAYYGRSDGVEVIYHGTDTSTFHPDNRERYRTSVRAEAGVPEGQFLALYVGDFQKGCRPAIRAVARTPGVTLLAVSNANPEPYRVEAEKEGVADRVIFRPFSRNVEREYAAADALVFPTLYDSFGLVITEAMASGLPVITNPSAGAAELITDGVDGLLTAEAWNSDEIAKKLTLLRDDQQLRQRLGTAARARVEPLTWDLTADRTLDVYQKVAAGI